MRVLASAVDIFSSHPSRGGDQRAAGHRLASFYALLGAMKTFTFA